MTPAISGPTYSEMLHPETQPAAVRRQAAAAAANELDPANLFNIHWRDARNTVRHVVLAPELTGAAANIIVLIGCHFPSGSHKVGPAYATLLEGELAGEIRRGENTIIGPSTGNFGIGVAYISRLMGYPAVVIMPEQMSAERYERIRKYGGQLDLTPGSESDVILVLERTEHYKKDARNKVLAQFELLPNYRFHRYVTGGSALEAARAHGNGRVAAFVSAPGSAGTLAAGDEIKAAFPEAVVCALEPRECSTLFNNGRGTHRIEGIGDKMVTLIHNVLTTDYVILIHDDDCVMGLELIEHQQGNLEALLHMPSGALGHLRGLFGISGICNVLGAIRTARYLGLRPDDNVVTIATDGFDRYPSVLQDLVRRKGEPAGDVLSAGFEQIFRSFDAADILDVRPPAQKQRLFAYKQDVWLKFGYSLAYLDGMKRQSFWDAECAKIREADAALVRARSATVAAP
jgi:cysteine synthase A